MTFTGLSLPLHSPLQFRKVSYPEETRKLVAFKLKFNPPPTRQAQCMASVAISGFAQERQIRRGRDIFRYWQRQ